MWLHQICGKSYTYQYGTYHRIYHWLWDCGRWSARQMTWQVAKPCSRRHVECDTCSAAWHQCVSPIKRMNPHHKVGWGIRGSHNGYHTLYTGSYRGRHTLSFQLVLTLLLTYINFHLFCFVLVHTFFGG